APALPPPRLARERTATTATSTRRDRARQLGGTRVARNRRKCGERWRCGGQALEKLKRTGLINPRIRRALRGWPQALPRRIAAREMPPCLCREQVPVRDNEETLSEVLHCAAILRRRHQSRDL